MSRNLPHSWLTALRVAGWFCVCLIVWLSWVPREWEARTGLPGQIEHFVAYAGTAAIFAMAYRGTARWRLAAAFIALAGILEIGQIWVPGRTSQVIDFAASSAGAVAGVLVGQAALPWLTRIFVGR